MSRCASLIYPGESGFWVAECPSLPGGVSPGETKEAAIQNIREAIEAYVRAIQEDGLAIPPDRFDAPLVASMTPPPGVSGRKLAAVLPKTVSFLNEGMEVTSFCASTRHSVSRSRQAGISIEEFADLL